MGGLVTVLRSKFAPAWPRHADGDRAYRVRLGESLTRQYSTDAHFAAYHSQVPLRLCREAIGAVEIHLDTLVFDRDAPGHVAHEAWYAAETPRLRALWAEHPGYYYYRSRGGYRLIYRLIEPWTLRTQQDADRWRHAYRVTLAYFSRRFGFEFDRACCDWQRLYRLPDVVRDRARQVVRTVGDPYQISSLDFIPSSADIESAKPKNPSKTGEYRFVASSNSTGSGVLYYLLRGRGMIGEPCPRGGIYVRCPNEAQHSATRADSTVLYPPDRPGQLLGRIHCFHGHCQMPPGHWLRFFSDVEIEAARAAAGIARAA